MRTTKNKTEKVKVIWLRLEVSLVKRLDMRVAQLRRETGKRTTRSDLIRSLLVRGLDAVAKKEARHG